jgi:hypothetical protein
MKKTLMLNRILLILFLALTIAPSCKKKKGDDQFKAGTISFKANGELKTFEVAGFYTVPDGSNYSCYILASMENNEESMIRLRIVSSSPITAKTYGNDSGSERVITFDDEDGYHYSNDRSSIPSTITITSISENKIQGTFSGTLIGMDSESLTITDGKFDCSVIM